MASTSSGHGFDRSVARLLFYIAVVMAVTGFGLAIALLQNLPFLSVLVLLHIGVGLVGLASVILLRSGREELAAIVMIWGYWIGSAALASSMGGLRGPNLINFPLIVVIAGWILGTRQTLYLVAVTEVLLVGLLVGDAKNWVPPADYVNPSSYLMFLTSIMIATAVMTLFSRRAYASRADEARQKAGELAVREGELLHLKDNLEVLVALRTDQLEQARNDAEIANIAKSRFLAAASHDLRQPMQAIGLFNDALARTDLNPEQKRISDHLVQSTRSLGDLLDALLDISTLDAGAVKASPEIIQVQALIHQIDAEFAPMAAEKSLRFKLSFPFRDMAMFTDGTLLMRLLRNLISNAIKYTRKGGVLVAIRRRGNHALVQVWDTGIGIAGENLDSIYEEYFQVGNDERDRSKGLGLGLAIARRIANLLETDIVCHSRRGKGSVFEIRLPLATNVSSSQSDTPKVAPLAKPAGRHIVLVEDDLMVGTATKLALESCGMTVARFKTAEEALADPDIVGADVYISDLRLPGKDGIEFLDAVQQRATKRIKAVLLTGDTAVNRIEMMRSTSWQVLFKPADLDSLLAAIEAQGSGR